MQGKLDASASMSALTAQVTLSNGLSMPRIHLGLYEVEGAEAIQIVKQALEVGYRAFDTAQWYANEYETGRGILEFLSSSANVSSLRREDIWVTTKLRNNSTYEAARQAIRQSVEESRLGYIDLFLLHSPYGGKKARLESWRAVEDAISEGEIKSGGVSNFGVKHV